MNRQIYGQMVKWTNGQMDKQTNTQIVKPTNRPTLKFVLKKLLVLKGKNSKRAVSKWFSFFFLLQPFLLTSFFSFCHSQIYIFFPIDSKFMSLFFLTLCFQYHNHVLVFLSESLFLLSTVFLFCWNIDETE
jgi:hypothetical protein